MSLTLETKASVLVTGASSGIGAEIAREFSRNGYFVFLLGRNSEKLKKVQESCTGPSEILAFDLKELPSFQTQILKSLENKSNFEVLVNCAGVFERKAFTDTSDDVWTEQFEVNLLSAVRLTRLVWPLFIKNKKGSIINISSTLGIKPVAGTSAYSSIKAAMSNWTLSLAQEGGSANIRANCICPGIIDTPIHDFHALAESEKNKILTSISGMQLLNQIGQPLHIAKAAYFLGSDQSAWTTGAVLSVDGGINLK
jgi:NAD(P)-dependent dehydrogenase (short-subunit alcohol dehydrogenase family)